MKYKPVDKIPTIYSNKKNENCYGTFEWGLIPDTDKNLYFRGKLYNIRVETVIETFKQGDIKNNRSIFRKFLKEAILNNRAIIPAGSVFEKAKKSNGKTYELISRNEAPLGIAAIYSDFTNGHGKRMRTVGMLTTKHEIFGRVALILDQTSAMKIWLNSEICEWEGIFPLFGQKLEGLCKMNEVA